MNLAELGTISVNVTQAHIDLGDPDNWYSCPIALALFNELHSLDIEAEITVEEGGYVEVVQDNSQYYTANLGEHASRFIEDFDNGIEVTPFTFNVKFEEST